MPIFTHYPFGTHEYSCFVLFENNPSSILINRVSSSQILINSSECNVRIRLNLKLSIFAGLDDHFLKLSFSLSFRIALISLHSTKIFKSCFIRFIISITTNVELLVLQKYRIYSSTILVYSSLHLMLCHCWSNFHPSSHFSIQILFTVEYGTKYSFEIKLWFNPMVWFKYNIVCFSQFQYRVPGLCSRRLLSFHS